MDRVTVYAHPTCSKSRAATALLDDDTVARILDMLAGEPALLVRTDDARYGELGLTAADVADRAGVVSVLVAHPELMQRPVVVRNGRAVVARPPELLNQLLDETSLD
jgi:arsenate reductase